MDDSQLNQQEALAETSRSNLNKVFTLLSALGGRTSPADVLEEDAFRVREGYHNFRLDEVEPHRPDVDLREAQRPADELVYFARMLQRTQLIGHFISDGIEVPVHYVISGAIILKRERRKFHVWEAPELAFNVVVPFAFVKDRKVLDDFQRSEELGLIDSGGDRPEYTQLRIAAVRHARQIALDQRYSLFRSWIAGDGKDVSKGLVASGIIADIPNAKLASNIFALGQRVYVPWQNSVLLEPQLLVPAYHRGRVLKITNTVSDDPMPKYTWFVRLRSSAQADPEFGLVRCTCLADNDEAAIAKANAFSARLIDERLPVTFPAERWDKLIFPLKLCMDYLNSLIATKATVKSYFARN